MNEMRNWLRIFCALFSLTGARSVIGACWPVHVENNYFELARSGHLCMEQDITRPGEPFAWMNGGETFAGGAVGYLGASNAELDLQGHSIIAKRLGVSSLHDAAKRLTIEDYQPKGI